MFVTVSSILKAFEKVLGKLEKHKKNMEGKVKTVDKDISKLRVERKTYVKESEKATLVIDGFKKLTGK